MTDLLLSTELVDSHDRAIDAVKTISNCTDQQADEVVTAIVALVFETLKHYLPGEDSCN